MRLILDRFVTACLYGVLLTPLVFEQRLMHPLVISKTLFFQILVMLACAGYAALALFHKEYRPRLTNIFIGVWVLFAAISVAGVVGVNPMRSLWSLPERMTGIVLMGHLAVYFTVLSGMRPSFKWRRYLQVSLCVSFLTALFPIIQLTFPGIFFDRLGDRLSGTIGNPIFLAAYLFFHVFIAGKFATEAHTAGKKWWPYAVVGLFDAVVILLTQTRGALVAFVVACVVLSVRSALGRDGVIARRAVFGLWVTAFIFAGIFFVTRSSSLWRGVPILSRLATEGFRADNRLYAWRAGLRSFADAPALGIGWDNFYIAFSAHYDPRLLRGGFTETFFDRPHNVFIQFLAETGVVGFAAYVFLLVCALRVARRDRWLVALFAAYLTQNFFAFDSMSSYFMFFLVLAWIDAERVPSAPPLSAYGHAAPQEIPVAIALFAVALTGIWFFDYRPYAASRLEWESVNHFVQARIPEGLEYMDRALAADTPYHAYIGKDLYPNIALLYGQDLPLPDVRNLIEKAVRGMTTTAEAEPLNYGFWIGLADMMQPIASLDPVYIEKGLAALARAEVISPRRQATEYVRAKLLNLKGDKAGAIAAMASAVALDPEVGDAHFFHALLLLESSRLDEGLAALLRATERGREPRSAAEASAVAAQLGDLGAYKESARFFQKALLFKPGDPELTMKLGLVYYFSGEKDAARRLIAEVIGGEDISRSPQYQSLRPILFDLGLESR